jgi:hypothetical protein
MFPPAGRHTLHGTPTSGRGLRRKASRPTNTPILWQQALLVAANLAASRIYKHKADFDSKSSLLQELKTMLTHKMITTYKNRPTDQKGYPGHHGCQRYYGTIRDRSPIMSLMVCDTFSPCSLPSVGIPCDEGRLTGGDHVEMILPNQKHPDLKFLGWGSGGHRLCR